MLKAGEKAPEIEVVDRNGTGFKLSDEKGKWVALYFYPKDETSGCTAEACAFRDNMETLTTLGIEVVGVSTQDGDSHRQFSVNHRLGFRLLPDPKKEIVRLYDALGVLRYARRVTYIIDPKGVIRDVYHSEIRPTSHAVHVKGYVSEHVKK